MTRTSRRTTQPQRNEESKPEPEQSTKRLRWDTTSSDFVTYHLGKIGKWTVFRVYPDGFVSKGDPKVIKLAPLLPGIKINSGFDHYETVEQAKAYAEEVIKYWIDRAGLK